MGDPATIMLIGSLASTGFSVVQSINASKFEKQQIDEQKKLEMIRSLQEENDQRQQLRERLATQRVMGAVAGRTVGFGGDSSLSAIMKEEENKTNRAIDNIRLFGSFRQNRLSMQSQQKDQEIRSAIIGGVIKAGSNYGDYRKNKLLLKQPKVTDSVSRKAKSK